MVASLARHHPQMHPGGQWEGAFEQYPLPKGPLPKIKRGNLGSWGQSPEKLVKLKGFPFLLKNRPSLGYSTQRTDYEKRRSLGGEGKPDFKVMKIGLQILHKVSSLGHRAAAQCHRVSVENPL